MKIAVSVLSAFMITMLMSSCASEVCIKCVKYDYSDSVEFCSAEKSERNDFQVEWIGQGYNCFQQPED